jgi:hypothetical protein
MEDGCMVKRKWEHVKTWKPIGINGCWSFDPLSWSSCYFMFVWNALQYGVSQFFFLFPTRFSSRVSTPMIEHRLVIEFSYSA